MWQVFRQILAPMAAQWYATHWWQFNVDISCECCKSVAHRAVVIYISAGPVYAVEWLSMVQPSTNCFWSGAGNGFIVGLATLTNGFHFQRGTSYWCSVGIKDTWLLHGTYRLTDAQQWLTPPPLPYIIVIIIMWLDLDWTLPFPRVTSMHEAHSWKTLKLRCPR